MKSSISSMYIVHIDDMEFNDSEGDVNFSAELAVALSSMPPMAEYIGCINCAFPIAYQHQIIEVISARRHPNIPVAFVLPMINAQFANTFISQISPIHWRTHVHCRNCDINVRS